MNYFSFIATFSIIPLFTVSVFSQDSQPIKSENKINNFIEITSLQSSSKFNLKGEVTRSSFGAIPYSDGVSRSLENWTVSIGIWSGTVFIFDSTSLSFVNGNYFDMDCSEHLQTRTISAIPYNYYDEIKHLIHCSLDSLDSRLYLSLNRDQIYNDPEDKGLMEISPHSEFGREFEGNCTHNFPDYRFKDPTKDKFIVSLECNWRER